jgi:ubiquinone/menaquinone biosynthesis C-methylase UbiE
MIRKLAIKAIDVVLSNPILFGLQQKLCNDYSAIQREFAPLISRPGVRILDIGCSVGTCAGQIIDMAQVDYTGIDIDPNYARIAQARYPHGKFHTMDASRMAFADQQFDVCMFICVLHHMSNEAVAACLGDIRRVLKPDGRILVAEPVFTPGHWFSSLCLHLDRGRFIRTKEGYRDLFQGFRLVREGRVQVPPHAMATMELALT